MNKKNNQLSPPSDEFIDAVCNSDSINVLCELCGRVHFGDKHYGDFDEGEFENLIQNHEKNPDKYIYHNSSSVNFGYLNEKQVVWGCPCNLASKYEKLFWNSRYIIKKYFSKRAEKMKEIAEDTHNLATTVKDAVNSTD